MKIELQPRCQTNPCAMELPFHQPYLFVAPRASTLTVGKDANFAMEEYLTLMLNKFVADMMKFSTKKPKAVNSAAGTLIEKAFSVVLRAST